MNDTHRLKQATTSEELAKWYDEKYTEMGDGWECPREEAIKYLTFAEIPVDKTKRLLDVGCGAGHFIQTAQEYAQCFGIDLSRVAVEKARTRVPAAHFEVYDMEAGEMTNKIYDYVVSIGSIEHCIDIAKALRECHRVLKDDGICYMLVPNEEWQHFDQVNETTYTDEEWVHLFREAGFKVTKRLRTGNISHFQLQKS